MCQVSAIKGQSPEPINGEKRKQGQSGELKESGEKRVRKTRIFTTATTIFLVGNMFKSP